MAAYNIFIKKSAARELEAGHCVPLFGYSFNYPVTFFPLPIPDCFC